MSSRLPELGGAEQKGAEDFAQKEPCRPGPPVPPTHFKRVCLLRQKTKYSPSWGSRMSLGSSPARTLGPSLSRPICRLLSSWLRQEAGRQVGRRATSALGKVGVRGLHGHLEGHGAFGGGCSPFLHGTGRGLFREGGLRSP